MNYYDIGEVFQKIEEDMIASMSRNLKRHLQTELDEGINYAMWQSEQLAALNEFKRNNSSLFKGYFSTINDQIEDVLRKAHETGKMDQEIKILEAIREGWSTALQSSDNIQGAFFRINDRKLNALINSVTNDMKKAETAMLRQANDEYRKIIFNSQAYYNTGAGTLSQCVDMATKDFLARGINCIEYANGARVGIDAYAKMALRTAQTRAYLLGESSKRDEWGVSTVIVNKRGVACPKCLKYVGKVFYDDVWGSAPIPTPEKYPRLSEAIAGGLYHPNCKDIHTTYFEGVSTPPKPMTDAEKKEASRVYDLEQRQRYNERQIRKYKRLSDGSVDPENQQRYQKKLGEWQDEQKRFVKANGDVLKLRYENESIYGIGPIDNYDTRRAVESMKREVEFEKIRASKAKALTNAGNSDIIDSQNNSDESVFNSIIGKQSGITKPYQDALNDRYTKGMEASKKAFNKYIPSDSVADSAHSGTPCFRPSENKVYMNFANDALNERGAGTTFFHEHGHYIDLAARPAGASRLSTATSTFGDLLKSDFKAYIESVKSTKGYKKIEDAYLDVSWKLMGNKQHSISDLYDALSGGKCSGRYAHNAGYWKRDPESIEKEAFAHMFEATFDSEKTQYMQQYFPNAFEEFKKLIKGVI